MNNDAKKNLIAEVVTRRKVLRGMGMALAALPLARLVMACGEGTDGTGGDTGTDAGTDTTADSGTGADAGTGSAANWAIGGTAAMTAATSYPDPFSSGIGNGVHPHVRGHAGPLLCDHRRAQGHQRGP